MSDLHLTESELVELEGMGVAGAAVAKLVRAVCQGDRKAIVHARNTAELVAAAVYHQLQIAGRGEWPQVQVRINAIGKALEEMS